VNPRLQAVEDGQLETARENLYFKDHVKKSDSMVCSLMIDQAEIACGNSDYTRAVALLTDVLNCDPKNIVAYVKRAMAYQKLKKLTSCINDLKKALLPECQGSNDQLVKIKNGLEKAEKIKKVYDCRLKRENAIQSWWDRRYADALVAISGCLRSFPQDPFCNSMASHLRNVISGNPKHMNEDNTVRSSWEKTDKITECPKFPAPTPAPSASESELPVDVHDPPAAHANNNPNEAATNSPMAVRESQQFTTPACKF